VPGRSLNGARERVAEPDTDPATRSTTSGAVRVDDDARRWRLDASACGRRRQRVELSQDDRSSRRASAVSHQPRPQNIPSGDAGGNHPALTTRGTDR
jgi:hypothetical protein